MSFSIEPFRLPYEHQISQLDYDGMCISDSPAHHQIAEAPPAYEQAHFLASPFDEEANELDPEPSFPASEPFITADARDYLQNRLMTYRMPLEIPDSASTEVEDSPVEEHPSPQSSPESTISTARTYTMTEDEKIDAALEAYIRQSSNPLTSWL
ncbi:MAG: hypothetical protein NTX49_05170 [Chlamydiae bacterium]|nr:hypothetical protein [Chlamydiota bacterium]